MVKRRPVESLRTWALRTIPRMVRENIVRTAHGTQASWYRIFTGEYEKRSEDVLELQISRLRTYLLEFQVWTDREDIFKLLLKGIDEGFQQIRNSWRPNKDHSEYTKILEAVSKFVEILSWPKLRQLDFREVPRSVRSRMLDIIPQLTGLTSLIIGPGNSGGWIPLKGKAASELAVHLSSLKQLQEFSMKKDCTRDILSAIVHSSAHSLRSLDMENSKAIGDEAVPIVVQCQGLVELNVFGTSIWDEGKARLIMGLPKLRHLVRGDFLCDALGWIDYLEEMEDPIFDIREFTPSQSYFFHETWQIEAAARMCPRIEKMLFIHHPDCCPSFLSLAEFRCLTELQLHGGSWRANDLDQLIGRVGPGLKHLGMISIKELSGEAVKEILVSCSSLQGIVFNNCEFQNQFIHPSGGWRTESLQELVITSIISCDYISWLLRSASRLRAVHLGSSTQVRDATFLTAIAEGGLEYLEDLQVERSPHLTLATMHALLSACPALKSLGDLGAWGGVTGPELGQVRQVVHEQNLILDISSHQVLRRFLGLAGEERQSMLNLLTGPLLERIRMAQGVVRNAAAIRDAHL